MAQEPGSEKCVCVAERRPLRVLRLQKRETCTFEFVLVWVNFERKGFESGFRDLTLRCKVLRKQQRPQGAGPGTGKAAIGSLWKVEIFNARYGGEKFSPPHRAWPPQCIIDNIVKHQCQ